MNYRNLAIVGLVVFSVLSVWIPGAAALTWTSQTVNAPEDATNGELFATATARSGNNRWIAWFDTENDDFMVSRSINGAAWATTTVATTNQLTNSLDIVAVTDNVVIACFEDETGDDIYFARSGNAGVLWSVVAVSTTDTLEACSLTYFSNTNYLVTWYDVVGTNIRGSLSTDSGATWGTPFTIDPSDRSASLERGPLVVRGSSTNAVLVSAVATTNAVLTCRTQNTGSTWACNTIPGATISASGSPVGVASATATEYAVIYSPGSTALNWCFSNDVAVSWGCGQAATLTVTSRSADIVWLGVDENSWGVAFVDYTATSNDVLWWTQTTDGGSWSEKEDVVDLGAVASPSAVEVSADFSQGVVTLGYQYDLSLSLSTSDPTIGESTATFSEQEALAATASVSVTGLVGFDVDPTGSGLIARLESGERVSSYDPRGSGTLTLRGTRAVTDCTGTTFEDMVTASDIALALVVCDAVDNRPKFFSIRGFDMNEYDFPGDCDPADDCLDDINFQDGCTFDDEEVVGQLDDLTVVPLDYSYITQSELAADDSRAVALAYTTTNGFVGVFEYTTVQGFDECNEERRAYAANTPEQLSVWQPSVSSDETYLAVADPSAPVKVFVYNPQIVSGELDGTLSAGFNIGVTGAVGVSCTARTCLTVTEAGSVRMLYIDNGTNVFPSFTVAAPKDSGVALSAGGEFFAVMNGADVLLGWTANGTVFGTLTGPSGTFHSVKVRDDFSEAWIATSTTISYYDIDTAFDEVTGGCVGGDCVPAPTTPAAGEGLFGNAGVNIGSSIGTGPFGGNMLLAVLLCSLTTAAGGASLHRLKIGTAGAIIGLIAGFMLSWAFNFLSLEAVVTIVVLGVLGIITYFFWMRGN